MRVLVEMGNNTGETAPDAAPGMPQVFAALEVLGVEFIHMGWSAGDDVLLLD